MTIWGDKHIWGDKDIFDGYINTYLIKAYLMARYRLVSLKVRVVLRGVIKTYLMATYRSVFDGCISSYRLHIGDKDIFDGYISHRLVSLRYVAMKYVFITDM